MIWKDFFIKNKIANFRLNQLNKAKYNEMKESFDDVLVLPKDIRNELSKNLSFCSLDIKEKKISKDNITVKFLLKTKYDDFVETVLLKHTNKEGKKWATVCISSQVGCAVGCVFCATGSMGFSRNLDVDEILDQFWIAKKEALKDGFTDMNIVFMGMGEPLLNFDNVIESIKKFKDKNYFGLGERRITISTSGIVPKIREIIKHFGQVRLAISLHASTQEKRQKIMPIAKSFPLDVLMKVLDEYVKETNKQILYEYVMINGVNDTEEDAINLVKLLRGKLAKVNLIPMNEVKNSKYKRSKIENIRKFKSILDRDFILATIRHTKGDDIDAACGQLVIKNKE